MHRTLIAASLLVLAAAAPAAADETQTVNIKCSSATTSCSTNFTMPTATHIVSVTCDWTASTVAWLELVHLTPDGNYVIDKQYLSLSADEKTSKATSRVIDRGLVSGSSQGMTLTAGDKLKMKLNSTTSLADQGTCYVTGR